MIKIKYYSPTIEEEFASIAFRKFKYILKKHYFLKSKYRRFVNDFVDSCGIISDKKIKDFIIEKPYELRNRIKKYGKLNLQKFYNAYDNLINSKSAFLYSFLEKAGVKTCPYCNARYTFVINSRKRSRPQFDHFFPRSKYPFLSVCLYNLIPCCPDCNRTKGDESVINMLSPFESGFNSDSVFVLKPKNCFGLFTKQFDIKLQHKCINYKKAINNECENALLCYNDFYNELKDYTSDLIKLHHIYNDSYLSSLLKNNMIENQYINRKELLDILYLNKLSQDDWLERPLSKYTSDIINYLDDC